MAEARRAEQEGKMTFVGIQGSSERLPVSVLEKMTLVVLGYSLLVKGVTSTFHMHDPRATAAGEGGHGSGSEFVFSVWASP